MESSALFVKQKNLTNRWATVLSCAPNDHFRYPLFHFRYPSKQLQFFSRTHDWRAVRTSDAVF